MEQTKKLDETVPGGRYKIGDQIVNAEGKPVSEDKSDEKQTETEENKAEKAEVGAKGKK
jgi:hypothetical protein